MALIRMAGIFYLLTVMCPAFTVSTDEEDCECWPSFSPLTTADGVFCDGDLVHTAMPCNQAEPPECKCSDNVTSIITDSTGIWCSNSQERWPCENAKEWDTFFAKHPNEKF